MAANNAVRDNVIENSSILLGHALQAPFTTHVVNRRCIQQLR